MAIDKAIYAAPQGLAGIDAAQPDMEIEIENPESLDIHTPGMDMHMEKAEEDDFSENLAEHMSEGQLQQIGGDLIGDFQSDIDSRKDWIQTYVDG